MEWYTTFCRMTGRSIGACVSVVLALPALAVMAVAVVCGMIREEIMNPDDL